MIEAETRRTGFAARLAGKAQVLADTALENRLRARRRDVSRWRHARLLWPLFTKD